jgi:hypothetical protein
VAGSSIRRASAETGFAERIRSVSSGQSVFQPRPTGRGPENRVLAPPQVQILSPLLALKGLLTRRNTGQEPFALHASCHLRAIPQRLMTNATTQTGPVRRHTHVERIIA